MRDASTVYQCPGCRAAAVAAGRRARRASAPCDLRGRCRRRRLGQTIPRGLPRPIPCRAGALPQISANSLLPCDYPSPEAKEWTVVALRSAAPFVAIVIAVIGIVLVVIRRGLPRPLFDATLWLAADEDHEISRFAGLFAHFFIRNDEGR